jgi:sugar fermentation stimulation protein A
VKAPGNRGAGQPGNRGAYLLLITLSDSRKIEVGGLGRLHFHPGNYVYVGSAMGGLQARVKRHLRPEKKLHWHIDHLLARAKIEGAVLFPSDEREECSFVRTLQKIPGIIGVARFGSTDCGCPSHLFYLGKRPFGRIMRMLDRPNSSGPDPSFWGSAQ